MRVWIDVREACRPRMAGKGRWTLRCVDALLRRPDVRATLLSDAEVPAAWKTLPGFAEARVPRRKGLGWHFAVRSMLLRERAGIDAYLSPTSFIVPFLVGKAVPVVPVVHDLIAFKDEPHDRKATFIERFTLPRALRTAAAVCTVSDATADALRRRFPFAKDPVPVFAGPTVDEAHTWTGRGDHVLCVGTLCPRKNQLRLIHAFAAMDPSVRAGTRLVLVGGRGWSDEAIVRAAEETPGVEWLGYRGDAELATLLRECRAYATLSEEEGFNLPVLDALRVGAPVLASDIPTAREVAGDCATYADPYDVGSIARGLEAVLRGPPPSRERADRQTERFAWARTAERVAEACEAR